MAATCFDVASANQGYPPGAKISKRRPLPGSDLSNPTPHREQRRICSESEQVHMHAEAEGDVLNREVVAGSMADEPHVGHEVQPLRHRQIRTYARLETEFPLVGPRVISILARHDPSPTPKMDVPRVMEDHLEPCTKTGTPRIITQVAALLADEGVSVNTDIRCQVACEVGLEFCPQPQTG
jgi:hypothetical protein